MYNDDDLFNMFNSYTTTETDNDTYQDTQTPQPSGDFQQQNNPYIDDYTTKQNFSEQKSYNSPVIDESFETIKQTTTKQMSAPTIKQSEKTVNLIKKREKLYFSPRLKNAAVVLAVIMVALVFATIWNFAWSARVNADFAAKQAQINEISQSINELKIEYNELTSVGDMSSSGYVEKVDGENSFTFSLDEFYTEPEIEKLSSNWFNDVCEFFSKIFA